MILMCVRARVISAHHKNSYREVIARAFVGFYTLYKF